MRILLFPTRFYPAISGGDFYLERLGTEFSKKSFLYSYFPDQRERNEIIVCTSNAIDFGALRGNGRIVKEDFKYYSNYCNLKIKRFKCSDMDSNKNLIEKTKRKIEKQLSISKKIIDHFCNMGPIFSDFFHYLKSPHHSESVSTNISIKKAPFDLIHCTYLPYNNLIYSLYLAKLWNIPCIITPFLHNENIRYQNNETFELLNEFDHIIACTEYEKKIFQNNGIDRKKISVINMGIDIDKFTIPRIELTKEIYPVNKPMVLFCGYKNYEKGAITLLNTIPKIDKSDKEITFVFIGPSTTAFNRTLSKVKKIIQNTRIINISPDNLNGVYDKKKIGLFQLADIYCMPSRSEAYGISYLEAWATKTPVIASDFSAMKEVIEHDKDGLLIEFGNEEQLRKTILYLINNPSIRKEMGLHGYNKIQDDFSWKSVASKTFMIYKKIVKNK